MASWTLHCGHCGTANRVPADELELECGTVSYSGVCEKCGKPLSAEERYWRWLGLNGPPPDVDEDGEGSCQSR